MAGQTRSSKRKLQEGEGSSGVKKSKIWQLRVPMPERGFDLSTPEMAHYKELIQARGWSKLCRIPKNACLPLVRDFYRGFETHNAEDETIEVRGVRVCISPDAINEFFKLQAPSVDDYERLLQDIPAAEVLKTLTVPGSSWIPSSSGESRAIRGKDLTVEPRIWLRFVSANLLPGTNVSRVTKERAVLIFCIMQGKEIDVGKLLHGQLLLALSKPKYALWFPSMVFSLCKKAGVPWERKEELTKPQSPIDRLVIAKMEREEFPAPTPVAAPKVAATAASQAPPSVPQWDKILQILEEQQVGMVRMMSLLSRVAQQVGVEEEDVVYPKEVSPAHVSAGTDAQHTDKEEVAEKQDEEKLGGTPEVSTNEGEALGAMSTDPMEEEKARAEREKAEEAERARLAQAKAEEEERLRKEAEAAKARELAELAAKAEEEARLLAEAEAKAAEEERELAELAEQAARAATIAAEKVAAAAEKRAAAMQASAEKRHLVAELVAKGTPSKAANSPPTTLPLVIPSKPVSLSSTNSPVAAAAGEQTPTTGGLTAPAAPPRSTSKISGGVPLFVTKGGRRKATAGRTIQATTSTKKAPTVPQPRRRPQRTSTLATMAAATLAQAATNRAKQEEEEESERETTSISDNTDDEPADEVHADSDSDSY